MEAFFEEQNSHLTDASIMPGFCVQAPQVAQQRIDNGLALIAALHTEGIAAASRVARQARKTNIEDRV